MSRGVGIVLVLIIASPLFALSILLVVNSGALGFGGSLPYPPKSTLEFGGREWTDPGFIGCWTEKRPWLPDRETCTESLAEARKGQLTGPEGSSMTFVYSGESASEGVSARVVDQNQNPSMEVEIRMDDRRRELRGDGRLEGAHLPYPGFESERLPVRQTGRSAEIPGELPPGEYLITIEVRVDGEDVRGTAYYDFNVVVQ